MAGAPASALRSRQAEAGAGEGNRTLVSSLEGYSFTTKLHPRAQCQSGSNVPVLAPTKLPRARDTAKRFFPCARVCYFFRRGQANWMRNLAALCLAIAFATTLSVRGDLTIVQKVEGPGQDGETTVKIKGDKERIDSPSQPSRIIDGKSGEMTDLLTQRKTFVRISAAQMKAAAETISKFEDGKEAAPAQKLTPTGKKETINGYETEEFTYQTRQFTASFWVATKYPDAAGILKEMQAPFTGAWKPSNMGMPDYTDFPGLPLKTVISIGDNKVTTTITSIKKDPINASEFDVPKDFEELKKPLDAAPPPVETTTASPSGTP